MPRRINPREVRLIHNDIKMCNSIISIIDALQNSNKSLDTIYILQGIKSDLQDIVSTNMTYLEKINVDN